MTQMSILRLLNIKLDSILLEGQTKQCSQACLLRKHQKGFTKFESKKESEKEVCSTSVEKSSYR
jgi:hypothetical protein